MVRSKSSLGRALGAWVLVLIALTLGTGCRRRPAYVTGQPVTAGSAVVSFAPMPTTVVLPGTQGEEEVRAAIARALEARSYVVETSEATRIVGRLTARRVSLRVALDFSPGQVVVTYLDSTGIEVDHSGSSRRYDGWMRQLVDTIQAEVARPERERQEAIARAEEQQRQREREVAEGQARERQRDRDERLERDRLAAAQAQAQADAERARAAAAEAASRPRIAVGTHVMVDDLEFDGRRARRARGALSLRAGFGHDPHPVRGHAGGQRSGTSMGFPEVCPGWFEAQPQHTIVLTTDVPYLRVEAPSDGDTTIAIVTPDGAVWCDDDSGGNYTPRLAGWFPAGVYRIYVGNYQPGTVATYQLLLSELGPSGYAQAAPPPPAVEAVPDCRGTLLQVGQPASSLMFCQQAEPYCAEAVLRAGRPATDLIFCRDVDPTCATQLIGAGRSSSELIHCR